MSVQASVLDINKHASPMQPSSGRGVQQPKEKQEREKAYSITQ